jgi:SAM-dependent methyltransferase
MTQDEIFAATEADRWFERNRAALTSLDPAKDVPLRLLDLYRLRPQRVLEVGGANGYRVAQLLERGATSATVVEPSLAAITDGRARYPRVVFHQGVARMLPVEGNFDLVIVHFVLHWIDRALLLQAIAEIDRVLAPDGHLVIGDFSPHGPRRAPYHHLPDRDVHTFKQDYAAIFTASGLYQTVASLSSDAYDLDSTHVDSIAWSEATVSGDAALPRRNGSTQREVGIVTPVADDRRTAVTLLRKRLDGFYASTVPRST